MFGFIDSKFDKVYTCRLGNLWQTPTLRYHLGRWLSLLGYVDERAVGVTRVTERITGPELIVEDLQRKRSIKAGRS